MKSERAVSIEPHRVWNTVVEHLTHARVLLSFCFCQRRLSYFSVTDCGGLSRGKITGA